MERIRKIDSYCRKAGHSFGYTSTEIREYPSPAFGRTRYTVSIYRLYMRGKLFQLETKETGKLRYVLKDGGQTRIIAFSQRGIIEALKTNRDIYGKQLTGERGHGIE